MPQTEEDHITGKDGKNTVPNGTETAADTKVTTNEQDVEVSVDLHRMGDKLLWHGGWGLGTLVNMFFKR